jgi:SAM-dependent methyltransferase
MDLGTGDGRHVLALAEERPDRLVVGVDASAPAMGEASRRASRRGLGNAIFVVADALSLPDGLAGIADELSIALPWGSLLHAAVAADPRLHRLLAPGGKLRLLVSSSAVDGGSGLAELDPDDLALRHRDAGLADVRVRPADLSDVRQLHSSWGKRLLSGGARGQGRGLWLLEARRGAVSAVDRSGLGTAGVAPGGA